MKKLIATLENMIYSNNAVASNETTSMLDQNTDDIDLNKTEHFLLQ